LELLADHADDRKGTLTMEIYTEVSPATTCDRLHKLG